MPNHERFPVADGVSLHAEVWPGADSQPPFLLVHGLSSNCRTWQQVGAHLSSAGYPAAAVDLRGHGQSDKPEDGYDFPTLIGDLRAVIRALGYERPVVVGQSTGGNLALELARVASADVSGAVGVDGGSLELQERWPDWEDCLENLAPPKLAGTPAADVERDIRKGHPDWEDWAVAATLANLEVLADGTVRPWLTADRHVRILRALWEHRPSNFIADLDVPVLLLLADSEDDELMPAKRKAADRAVAAARSARVEWFPGGDHDLHLQQPENVVRSLLEAVRSGFVPT